LILKILETFIEYFTGSFYAFDQMIHANIENNISRFGLSFLGLDTLIVSGFLRFIFGLDIASLLSQSSYLFHHGVYIGNVVVVNAHYTMLFSPYLDGGYVFIVIFLFIIGFILPLVHYKFYNNITLVSFALIFYMYYFLLFSTVINSFEDTSFFMSFLLIILNKLNMLKIARKRNDKNIYSYN
jgi:hypothetical protein